MSKDGGAARNMTVRQEYKKAAITGIVNNGPYKTFITPEQATGEAAAIADALIAEDIAHAQAVATVRKSNSDVPF